MKGVVIYENNVTTIANAFKYGTRFRDNQFIAEAIINFENGRLSAYVHSDFKQLQGGTTTVELLYCTNRKIHLFIEQNYWIWYSQEILLTPSTDNFPNNSCLKTNF